MKLQNQQVNNTLVYPPTVNEFWHERKHWLFDQVNKLSISKLLLFCKLQNCPLVQNMQSFSTCLAISTTMAAHHSTIMHFLRFQSGKKQSRIKFLKDSSFHKKQFSGRQSGCQMSFSIHSSESFEEGFLSIATTKERTSLL